jgi:sugar O-acyltransferase (sialic acid O-acetyltransferase NeuD family)
MRAVLIGAGGHARAVIEAVHGGDMELVACTDPRTELHGTMLDGVAVVGGDDRLAALRADGVMAAVLALGAVGDNALRARLFEALSTEHGFALPPVISRHAAVAQTATVGAGCVVLAMAVVGPGAVLGRNVIVNSGAIVEHDCTIGDHAHVASGATLGGAVAVGACAHVGLGAAVRHAQRIGDGALVAAGAVVVTDVPAGATVMGCPAREVSP